MLKIMSLMLLALCCAGISFAERGPMPSAQLLSCASSNSKDYKSIEIYGTPHNGGESIVDIAVAAEINTGHTGFMKFLFLGGAGTVDSTQSVPDRYTFTDIIGPGGSFFVDAETGIGTLKVQDKVVIFSHCTDKTF